MAGDDGSGPVRRALTGLLDAWLELDRQGAQLLEQARARAAVVAQAADGARPDGAAIATEAVSQLRVGTAAAEQELAGLAAVFADETRALAELLTGAPGVVAPAALGSGPDAIVAAFPAGGQRAYVGRLVADAAVEERQPSETAERAPAVNAIPLSVVAGIRAAFDESVREDVLRMVCHPRGHAVQLHGPDVPDEALMARVSWRKDPMGRTDEKNSWRRDPDDGTVHTKHQLGHVAGRFSTVAALAKPIKALLAYTGGTLKGLRDYLDRNSSPGGAMIFVPAEDANLMTGDATGFRGAGTSTKAMAKHWNDARRDAMANGGGPMPIVRTDQIADGGDSGAAIVFRKIDGEWVMITCYPETEQRPKFVRMGRTDS